MNAPKKVFAFEKEKEKEREDDSPGGGGCSRTVLVRRRHSLSSEAQWCCSFVER